MNITEPGVYEMPADVYHADPVEGGSLSSSGARKLLPPGCPARFRWEQDNPPAPKSHLDLGQAAHKVVLGTGPELVVVPGDRWDTNDAKARVAEARARCAIPLKQADYDRVQAMAAKLREHPIAAALFRPGAGKAEQSLVWVDDDTGVSRRARFDWLPEEPAAGRLLIPDYKTARSAEPEAIQRAIWDHGYHMQAAWYIDGAAALELGDDPQFLLVVQEKEPPYLVTVVQPDPFALRLGRYQNRNALWTYHECAATGYWPGYSDEVEFVGLPAYVENRYAEALTP